MYLTTIFHVSLMMHKFPYTVCTGATNTRNCIAMPVPVEKFCNRDILMPNFVLNRNLSLNNDINKKNFCSR